MKKLQLWHWGLVVIAAGVAAGVFGGPSASRAEALGRGFGQLCFVVVGLALIVAHLVRKRRSRP